MKALTLYQPYASLIALGAKTIETRSWSTSYRGPLAIHAAARKPDVEMMETGPAGEIWDDDDSPTGSDECLVQWGSTPAIDYMARYLPPPSGRWWITLAPDHMPQPMPLGMVVATCELVDVVPMVPLDDETTPCIIVESDRLTLCLGRPTEEWHEERNVTHQRPYGDYRPGRFGWLLAGIRRLEEPVPAKGKQGLWEWDRLPG